MENMFTYSELLHIKTALKWQLDMEKKLLKSSISRKESETIQKYCENDVKKTKSLLDKVENLLRI